MVVMGLGISFDVENLRYGVLDHDQTSASRVYLENFAGSRYFRQVATFANDREAEDALLSGKAPLVVEIPPGFGDDLQRGRRPEVAFWIEGGMPFRAENIRAYAKGIHERYVKDLRRTAPLEEPVRMETRYRYNQDFRSIFAIAPACWPLLMLVIRRPSPHWRACGARKELGSITNLYASPATRAEFLLGKQLPYAVIALGNFVLSVLLVLAVFEVPFKGSWLAYGIGALIYVQAADGLGPVHLGVHPHPDRGDLRRLHPDDAAGDQLLRPDQAGGVARGWGAGVRQDLPRELLPHDQRRHLHQALDWNDLVPQYLALAVFVVVFLGLSLVLLKTQER